MNAVRITLDWQGKKYTAAYDLESQTISSIVGIVQGQLEGFDGKNMWAARAFEIIDTIEADAVDVDYGGHIRPTLHEGDPDA